MRTIFLLLTAALTATYAPAQNNIAMAAKQHWVDSVYHQLSLEERIGQLFMVAAYSGGEKENSAYIQSLIDKHQIGGLIFMQGTPEAQAKLTNAYQHSAQVPLLIAMDAEWGLGMRLTGVKDLPKQMTIAAANNDSLMYEIGTVVAMQCRRLGVHINFAPSVDVNNNPKNPVIGFRSFGSDKDLVSRLGLAYTKALQNNGIMACAKHFPGHGDVSVDSHHDLPVINKSKTALKTLELYPFQHLIDSGVQSVMIAHLNLPQIDTGHIPSTLSYNIVTELLQKEMHFKGLIFTDALDMKGVTKYYSEGEVELKAFLAGNDVLLFSQNAELGIKRIQQAYLKNIVTENRLAYSVKKILAAKYEKNLHNFHDINVSNVTADLNSAYAPIMQKTAQQTATLIGKDKNLERFRYNSERAFILFNATDAQRELYRAHYPNAHFIIMDQHVKASYIYNTLGQLPGNTIWIGSLHQLSRYPGQNELYGYTPEQIEVIQYLAKKRQSILLLYGVPYLAQHFCKAAAVLVAYEDNTYFQDNIINIINGTQSIQGRLPVEICR